MSYYNFVLNTECKVCNAESLKVFAHTATCQNCGVLLCYPYPEQLREEIHAQYESLDGGTQNHEQTKKWLDWHVNSGFRNHHNFTNMVTFCLEETENRNHLDVLDYGGGGGQFALVFKSLFPKSTVYIVDLINNRLLDQYRPMNFQILYHEFEDDEKKFDVIFLNDVYEHVTFPSLVLDTLRKKLKSNGKIFIDTPCAFWLYPVTRIFSKRIHTKLLKGTVDFDHQQIWTKKSFQISISKAGLQVIKFKRLSEYTQPPSFYMDNMEIKNPLLRAIGYIFVKLAPLIASNKIMAVLMPRS